MRRLAAFLLIVWLGMHVGFGYIAAPALFHYLERMKAGEIAGVLFHWANYLGLAAAALAFAVCRQDGVRSRYRQFNIHRGVLLLWCLLAVNEWLLAPLMAAVKDNRPHWLYDWVGGGFGMWHGMSSVLHLLSALLGLALCWIWLRRLEWSR